MKNNPKARDEFRTFEVGRLMEQPQFPLLHNPLVAIPFATIALWALIFGVVAAFWG